MKVRVVFPSTDEPESNVLLKKIIVTFTAEPGNNVYFNNFETFHAWLRS